MLFSSFKTTKIKYYFDDVSFIFYLFVFPDIINVDV